ncbi:RHS repeat-associated core domain-containing protein [Pseudomonas japonica]|uniref:RHS repeat-associated core domain-containing protein n=1 Tax=Pseudomonas japonica TaxID=256466 RepID=A0A239B353_9PSED|nr:RHS repeat-associated core domain-containing protein [Pseudomonas japonica]SNS01992.1 RHS repeat-associated core domain-containing protein [Pseudomonas japonica]
MNTTRLLACDHPQSVLRAGHQAIVYSAYGHRHPVLPVAVPGFNGELPDALTGHYLLGNGYRAYNPVLMRFNSPDSWSPFGRGGLNAYGYCLGDPVNRRDPGGHFSARREAVPQEGSAMEKGLLTGLIILGGVLLGIGVIGGLVSKVDEFMKLSRKALTRGPGVNQLPASRAIIENGLAATQNPSSFTKALILTNRNLGSHNNTDLTVAHAHRYVGTAREVEAGTLSNTSAHWRSAVLWMKTPGTSGAVGGAFNLVATVVSGGIDASERKSGQALRRRSL